MKKFIHLIVLLLIVPVIILFQTSKPGWRFHNNLSDAIKGHRTLMLPDGNVLITGGINSSGAIVNSSWIYDYKIGSCIQISGLNDARAYHCLISIPIDSVKVRIFAIGGYSGSGGSYSSISSIEILDYEAGQSGLQWKKVNDLNVRRGNCSATWDKAQSIVVAGGETLTNGALNTGTVLSSSEIVNINFPYSAAKIGDMGKARIGGFLCTIINNNNANEVLAAGCEIPKITSSERLSNQVWSVYANPPKQYRMNSAYLSDLAGIARMFGGEDETGKSLNTCEWYDVSKQIWKYLPNMISARSNTGITQIAGSKDSLPYYLIVAGKSITGSISSTEYYTLPTLSSPGGYWVQFYPLNIAGSGRTVNMTGSNLPVVIAGEDNSQSPISSIEIFQPISANDINFLGSTEIGGLADSIPVDIKNEWLLPVKLTNFRFEGTSQFFITGDTSKFVLQSGGSRRIFVWFLPNLEGTSTANLLFNIDGLIDTIKVTGTATKSSIGVITNKMSFGDVFLGKDTLICFQSIKNLGTDTTYIDSVSISPKPDYELISPKGRITLPPDSSLTICVRFNPQSRMTIYGTVIMNIAKRRFASALDGNGVLAYIKGNSNLDCDTVNYIPNQTYNAIITLRNPSDRSVTITKDDITGGSQSMFSINQTIYPFTLNVGDRKDITVTFTPQNEGSFNVNVKFINTGAADSASNIPICFVVRSRNISLSSQNIDFGSLCLGDSVQRTILIENPSNFENITLDSIKILEIPNYINIIDFHNQQLSPRDNTSFIINYKPLVTGQQNYQVVIYGSFGSTTITLSGKALAPLSFSGVQDYYSKPSEKVQVHFKTSNFSGFQVTNAKLKLLYNKTVLLPTQLVSILAVPLNMSKSIMTVVNPGELDVNLQWNTPISVPSDAFAVEFETLIGNSDRTNIFIQSVTGNDYCIQDSLARVFINGICGGNSGLIYINSKIVLAIANSVTDENKILLKIVKNYTGEANINIFNSIGEIVYQTPLLEDSLGVFQRNIELPMLSVGVYFCTVTNSGIPLVIEPFGIIR